MKKLHFWQQVQKCIQRQMQSFEKYRATQMKKVPLYSFTHFSRFISICKKLELMLYYKQCYVSLLFLIDSNCKKMLKFGNIGSQLLMVVKSYFFRTNLCLSVTEICQRQFSFEPTHPSHYCLFLILFRSSIPKFLLFDTTYFFIFSFSPSFLFNQKRQARI